MAIRDGLESEVRARKAAQEAIRANESEFDEAEIIRLLEEEMLQAAQNLEFERAAQLRDKINEMKGAPTIKSGSAFLPDENPDKPKIWEPRSKGRPKKHIAK